jgi:manganese/zinc/iron transport system substrate-binding protein
MLRVFIVSSLVASLLFPLSLGQAQASAPLRVVATTTQASDAVRVVAGALVDLSPLMGAGVDPHLYQPTTSDIQALNRAQVVVYSGLRLEGKFDEIFEALSERGVRIYRLAQKVEDQGFALTTPQGTSDPHFWFDPRNWELSILGLAETLAELDPAHAEIYRGNAQTYVGVLQSLYTWGVEALQAIPAEQRVLVTSHDAFAYFGDAFGLEVEAIQGISTADEAGVSDIQAIVDVVITRQIPVIFVESSVPPNTILSVQEAARSQGWEVRLGVRELFSDAMATEGEYGATYLEMLIFNILTVLQSFGAEVLPLPELLPQPPAELLAIGG